MQNRYKVSGKTVQVADKGLNCASNIYAAVKEANDGYNVSKSIHGRNLNEKEKKWVVLENDKIQRNGSGNRDRNRDYVFSNQKKLNEDLTYAGYNLMATSELDMEPLQVYQTYHNLWKIEESFRITKSYLDALYLSEKEVGNFFQNCMLPDS